MVNFVQKYKTDGYSLPLFSDLKSIDTEFTQYRSPVPVGPSLKT
jgi:hypothetical protein